MVRFIVSSALGAALYGAIGAGAGRTSRKHPILKGALVASGVGVVGGLVTGLVMRDTSIANGSLSGIGAPPHLSPVRGFP